MAPNAIQFPAVREYLMFDFLHVTVFVRSVYRTNLSKLLLFSYITMYSAAIISVINLFKMLRYTHQMLVKKQA